jgi:hypothetical protein
VLELRYMVIPMLRLNCLPALLAVALNAFSGSLCCCVTGQLFGLACCESEHSSSNGSEQKHSCCQHSHSHSHPHLDKEKTVAEKHDQSCYQSSGCACAHQQIEVIPAVESKIDIAQSWVATIDVLSLIDMAPLDSEIAVRVVRSDPPIPPGCPMFIIHSTFLV